MKKRRLVLLSFYDKDGIADEYVFCLLRELKTIASEIVVIINGSIRTLDKAQIEKMVNQIIERPNRGYDAGAYKDFIFNYKGIEYIKQFDELILCNDTFFGPFVPFEQIWKHFEEKRIDFWGLHFWQAGYLCYVSSFFLVFRRSILMDDRFYKYWMENIDEQCNDVKEVYGTFEVGLFYELCAMGYQYGVYADNEPCHTMKSPDYAIENYNVPFVKKKIFDSEYYQCENVYKALSYISKKGMYDINVICKSALRKYGWKLDEKILANVESLESIEYKTFPIERKVNDIYKLRIFCDKWKDETIFIYGAGHVAAKIYFLLRKHIEKFGGFIVSKPVKERLLFGFPITGKENHNLEKECIIVGLNAKYSDEVRKILPETEKIIYIWG